MTNEDKIIEGVFSEFDDLSSFDRRDWDLARKIYSLARQQGAKEQRVKELANRKLCARCAKNLDEGPPTPSWGDEMDDWCPCLPNDNCPHDERKY